MDADGIKVSKKEERGGKKEKGERGKTEARRQERPKERMIVN